MIAAPDKEYTFDKDRPLTPFNVLIEAYESGLSEFRRATKTFKISSYRASW